MANVKVFQKGQGHGEGHFSKMYCTIEEALS